MPNSNKKHSASTFHTCLMKKAESEHILKINQPLNIVVMDINGY